VCSISPVRYLGRISYGLYLWHWPIFLVLDHSRTGLLGWPLFALRAAVSLSAAALSYHLVEMPIRRGALAPKIGRVLTPAAIGTTALAILLATATGTPSLAATAGPNAQSLQATAQYYGSPTSKSATDVPAGAVPGVAPATPHVAAGSGGPIRLLLLGDSEAAFLAFGLAPGIGRYGVEYQGDGVFGCGMLYDGPTLFRAIVSNADLGIRIPKVLVTCSNQLTRWRNDIANYHPDVIALEEGSIDVRDHYVDGHWTYLGQPGFDNLELGAIDTAVRLFLQSGANVMLLTAPYYQQPEQPDGQPWPEDSPARVNVFNHLLAEVAARYPGRVELVALGARLDPGGRYTAVIDGQQMRFSDGIHPTVAAGKYVQVWLAPKIAALGRLARERERLTAPAASG